MFAQDFLLHQVAVKGEISNCKYHSSGHIYFTLKDGAGAMAAVMFAGNRKSGLKFQMKEGDKVVVTGSIEVYERDGKYQLYAREIVLDGAGDLFQRYEALKKELEEMGMFDPMFKKPIPKYAKRIGIVTAPTGAAIQDIRNIASRRNPYVQLILVPAQVQGEGAAVSIVNGIHALEHIGVDIIIVGRGGGSIEDLWAFNEEIVARAIFECPIPIISAVGHETDTTIADYVSDLRAPTPSAAAELAVYDYRQTMRNLEEARSRMDTLMRKSLAFEKQRLSSYETRLKYLSPQSQLNEKRKLAIDMEEKIRSLMDRKLQNQKHKLALYISKLEANSPTKRLSSGYAYVEDQNGHGIKSVKTLKKDDKLLLHILDGQISATVDEISTYEV